MMEISRFTDFLTSLSDMCRWHFEVWDSRARVFTTAPGKTQVGGRENLAASIMRENIFQVETGSKKYLSGVPIRSDGMPIGALLAWSNGFPNSSPADPVTVEPFLRHITEVLEGSWTASADADKMVKELSQNYEDLHLYGRLSSLIKTIPFSVSAIEDLIGEIHDALHAELVFVRLNGSQDIQLIMRDNPLNNRFSDSAGFAGRLIAAIPEQAESLKEHYFVVNDSRLVPGYGELHTDQYRALLVTIQSDRKFYGWIGVVSFNMNNIFRRGELRLIISIAGQVAVAITNTDLYNDLEQFAVNVVKSLIQVIEAKDTYTRGHSERVNRFSMLLAEKMALRKEQKTHLQWASMLHDIGKVGIAETILNKPSSLTRGEYDQIKTHPTKGYTILKPLETLAGALSGIWYHHERYDGTGYPDGLKGKNIPLLARIIAVSDTFDALNSDRAYRPGKSVRESLDIMQSLAGTKLDKQIVRAFIEIMKSREESGKGEGKGHDASKDSHHAIG
ncbi:MAG TPA: HD domain-containing phosphohydrolase [Syntrophales bacterium]|nr:HD domain-containing phosphohydrolase [Syntrophales bacterium]